MKTYKNKKFYNFKEVHKRKKRSIYFRWDHLGKEYKIAESKKYRAKCKVVLQKLMNNREVEFPLHKKTMSWDA